jgi:hypothetical protein
MESIWRVIRADIILVGHTLEAQSSHSLLHPRWDSILDSLLHYQRIQRQGHLASISSSLTHLNKTHIGLTSVMSSSSHHEKKRVACIASDTQEYKGPFVLWGVACYTSDTPAITVSWSGRCPYDTWCEHTLSSYDQLWDMLDDGYQAGVTRLLSIIGDIILNCKILHIIQQHHLLWSHCFLVEI